MAFFASSGVFPDVKNPEIQIITAFAIIEETLRLFFLSRSIDQNKAKIFNVTVSVFFGIGFAGFEWILKSGQFGTMQYFSQVSWYPFMLHVLLSLLIGIGIIFQNRFPKAPWIALGLSIMFHYIYNTSFITNIMATQ